MIDNMELKFNLQLIEYLCHMCRFWLYFCTFLCYTFWNPLIKIQSYSGEKTLKKLLKK